MNDKDARDWYEKEALEQTWSVTTLQRNISSQYYYRMFQTQRQDLVENEMKELTAGYQNDKYELIKSPVIAVFLGFAQNTDFTESDLEKSIDAIIYWVFEINGEYYIEVNMYSPIEGYLEYEGN